MTFPNNKKFALTIIDDTDGDEIENTRPVYDFLSEIGLKATKTIWALPPKDNFRGLSLSDYRYRQYIKKLERKGFEIALHSVGSGKMTRQDTLDGLEIFRQFIGSYPKIQANHAQNPDSIYWGIKRLTLLRPFWRFSRFKGDNPEAIYFWGDYHKKHILYTRNLTFDKLNTIKIDRFMPYKDRSKELANYWFSASDGSNIDKFNRLTDPRKVERLAEDGGAAIIYTHFASGFLRRGVLDRTFRRNMRLLASQGGWFPAVGELLDYLLKQGRGKEIKTSSKISLEIKWLWDKLF